MRKSLLLSTSIAALVLGASGASAEESVWSNRYVSLFGAYSSGLDSPFMNDASVYDTAFKGGFTVGGAYGHYLTPSLRGEIEGSYQHYSLDSYTQFGTDNSHPARGHVDSINVMLNLWKDIDLGAGFTPYVGGGAGIGYGSMSIDWNGAGQSEGSSFGFASQLGAGVRMDVSDRVKFDLGYRLRGLYGLVAANGGDAATDITLSNYFNHSLQAGFTYMLGDYDGNMDALEAGPSDIYYTFFAGAGLPQPSAFAREGYTYEANSKVGFTAGAAVGTSLLPGWRGELEAAYSQYAHDNYSYEANDGVDHLGGDSRLYTLTTNLWRDKQIGSHMAYVGGGVGFALADVDGIMDGKEFDGTGLGLALNFGAGVRHAVSDDLAIDFGYRARGVFGAMIDGVGTEEPLRGSFLSHILQVGLTYGEGMFETPEVDEAMSQGHYVSLFGGIAKPEGAGLIYGSYTYEFNYKTGFTVGTAVGTEIADDLRGELELSYIWADACGSRYKPYQIKCNYDDDGWAGHHHAIDLLANVWRDFNFDVVSPYVGGGVGLSAGVLDLEGWGDPSLAMAAQVGGGVRYALNDDLTFDLGYRFKGVFDPLLTGHNTSGEDDDHGTGAFFTHTVTGGVAWDF